MRTICSISLTCIILVLMSCNNKKNEIKEERSDFQIRIDFPDTVFVNEFYNGKIIYKNRLDTVTTKLNDINKYRFIDYVFLRTQKINYKEEHLKKMVTDTFTSETNRIIPLYNISFDKLGVNYIDGVIIDEVSIDNGAKDRKGNPMARVITDEFRVTKKVVVVGKK